MGWCLICCGCGVMMNDWLIWCWCVLVVCGECGYDFVDCCVNVCGVV